MKKGLFIFHRDLRVEDNNGLIKANSNCDKIYTCFIFSNDQVKKNIYKSNNSVEFMIESLNDLQKEIEVLGGKLILCFGKTETVLNYLIEQLEIDILFFNEDYTPYAKQRQEKIEQLCKKNKILYKTSHDYCICPPGNIINNQEKPYIRFKSFYENYFFNYNIPLPNKKIIKSFSKSSKPLTYSITIKNAYDQFIDEKNDSLMVHGGRTLGEKQLETALKNLKDYVNIKDDFSKETSLLSAYIKYGCLSIREVLYAFRKKYSLHHELIRQLIWRDFYMHHLYFYPESLGQLYNSKMSSIKWTTNDILLTKWKEGKTGFPLLDAGMRQMNQTGYMHNRARMLVASMLSKIFFLDWREGEKYFAQNLIDYDVSSNSGNWQAVVGGGLYAMPWYHIINPWTQSMSYDNKTIYIKKWVPELKDVSSKHIHKWYKYYKKNKNINYPKPVVDFNKNRDNYIEKIKSLN